MKLDAHIGWEAVGMLERAAEYLLESNSEGFWTTDLEEASNILMDKANKLRRLVYVLHVSNPFKESL